MPLISTRGAASAQGFGEFAQSAAVNYIEDVFSTYLYTGNGSTQTITNGIDLSGKGGLVWMKGRSDATDHALYDTTRGATKDLVSNSTAAETTEATGLTAFSGTGFSIGALAKLNTNAATYASWTFRKQAKFFDVVTYTGDGTVPRSISHGLGSVPGFIAIKLTSGVDNWICRHRSAGDTPNDMTNYTTNSRLFLNLTNAASGSSNIKADASTFTVNHVGDLNTSGQTYVAYLFAHDAGGFGLSGTDNVISCGSFTADGSGNADVTLGYEPQWLLVKAASDGSSWSLADIMRGMPVSGNGSRLFAQSSSAESLNSWWKPNATGFTSQGLYAAGTTVVYIAIRRGPMKVPTSGTSVFSLTTRMGTGAAPATVNSSITADSVLIKARSDTGAGTPQNPIWGLRLTGDSAYLRAASVGGSQSLGTGDTAIVRLTSHQTNMTTGAWELTNDSSVSSGYVNYFLKRSPQYHDVVYYTGTGVNRTVSHNLSAVPEIIFVKRTDATGGDWQVYSASVLNTEYLVSNSTAAKATGTTRWNSTTPTSTVFSLGTDTTVNGSAGTYVALLFATCPRVSKVGSYTGSGTTKQIDCGFTAGARFVLIKRTDSTGDWYIWDTARGIVASSDPYFVLNSTAAEVTGTDYVDTYSAGFELSSTAPAGLNANGGTYIFLAIA